MVAIVTDSSVYMTKKEANELNVRIVPITYTVNGFQYNETFADCNGNFQKLIGQYKSDCHTAHPNISAYMSAFEELISEGYQVLCITISSRLSGAYSSALIAAKEVDPEKITIVDSLSTAGGLFLLVKEAKAMAISGMARKEIATVIRSLREKVIIDFSVDDLTALKKSGRLGIVRQSVSTILNIKPIFRCVEGAVISKGTARGKYDQIRQLTKNIPKNVTKVIVHYVLSESTVSDLKEMIVRNNPSAQVELRCVGPVLAINLGISVVGVVWME